MSEYIDRDKIFSTWRSIPAPASLTSLAEAISKTPAEDVVPVVRCKDCKWFYETKDEMDSLLCLNRQWDNGQPWRAAVKLDDFCSYGERKEPDNEVSEP